MGSHPSCALAKFIRAAWLLSFLSAFSLSVFAEEADTAKTSSLEEILVTALKTERNLEDVPVSLSVLPGIAVEKLGANSLTDLNGLSPNVILQGMVFMSNTVNLSIRGIGFADTDPFADQKTQVLIDGIPHARITGLGHDKVDIERIEVLRGPQGSLFGRNSLAGTINVISKNPDREPGLLARITRGEYGFGKYVLSAETGQLMNDALRARLTVSTREYNGHVINAFTDRRLGAQESDTLRLKIAHRIANLESSLTFYLADESTDGLAITNLTADPQGSSDGDVHLTNHDTNGFNDSKEEGFTLLSDIELDLGKISIQANSHDSEFFLYTDLDGRAGAQPPAAGRNPGLNVNIGFDIDHSQESFELRFHGDHSTRWDYVVGVFAFREKSRRLFYQNIGRPFSATLTFEDAALTTVAKQRTESIAAFGRSEFHINDSLSLIVGGRFTQDEKSARVANYSLPPPAPQLPPIIIETTTSWDQPTYQLGAQYEISDSVMWYLMISTGYRAGGFTSRATVPENVGPYDAEYVTNHEIGVKANLFDNRLRLSAALFYARYEDLVGWVRRTNSTGRGTEPVNKNLGEADIYGLEFDSTWSITSNLNLDFSVGLLDASWDSFMFDINNDGIVTDNSHLDLVMAPDASAYAALRYTLELGGGELEYQLDARYQSRYNSFGESNDDVYYRPAATLVNGSITWTWGEKGHSISLFGRNLTDKDVPRTNWGTALFPVAVFEPPRLLGVELQFHL